MKVVLNAINYFCQLINTGACMVSHFNHVRFFVTLWTVALQDSLSMGFFRQEYWSGLPCPPPGDLPDPGIEPTSLVSSALAGRISTTGATLETQTWVVTCKAALQKPHYYCHLCLSSLDISISLG